MSASPKILLINGSPHASDEGTSNTRVLLSQFEEALADRAQCEVIELVQERDVESLKKRFDEADGFVFATGTYWDSWGSPLQGFLEKTTPWEGSPTWLGKPAAVLVTMHSVGGKSVLSRLQGVLSTLGLVIPPMSGVVYSYVAQRAMQKELGRDSLDRDFWSPDDFPTIIHNLLCAVEMKSLARERGKSFKSWAVDREDPAKLWIRG